MIGAIPFPIESDSPNELVLLLDSLIGSSLCPHTKDWICFLYLRFRSWLPVKLGVHIDPFQKDRPFSVRYANNPESVPLALAELLSHIIDLNKSSTRRIKHLEQVQQWKIHSRQSTWLLFCRLINKRVQPRIWLRKRDLKSSASSWEIRNPALWFALQGRFTLGDFLRARSFTWFIEMHWTRLVSQSDQASLNEHLQWCCRCPGYELASRLASQSFDSLNGDVAEAVSKEIISHIDPRILQAMEPYLCQDEDSRRRGTSDPEDWYTPKIPAGRWKFVSDFKALAAISDRLVGAFESIKNDPQFISMAKAQPDQDQAVLASQIKEQCTCEFPCWI